MPQIAIVIAAAVANAAAAVASVAAAIASVIGAAVSGVISVIGNLAGMAITKIAGAVSGIFSLVSGVGKFVIDTLSFDLVKVGKDLAGTAAEISKGLVDAIKSVTVPATQVITKITESSRGLIIDIKTWVEANPVFKILEPIRETLVSVKEVVDAVKEPVEAIMEPVKLVRQTITDISSLRIIGDVLKGTASISELLGPVAEGKNIETAAAIAELTKAITTTTVSTMDKIDSEFELLEASVDSFDERIASSLDEYTQQSKAELMAVVTPKLDTLGKYHLVTISQVAKISRHIEDEGWFAAMLIKVLSGHG